MTRKGLSDRHTSLSFVSGARTYPMIYKWIQGYQISIVNIRGVGQLTNGCKAVEKGVSALGAAIMYPFNTAHHVWDEIHHEQGQPSMGMAIVA